MNGFLILPFSKHQKHDLNFNSSSYFIHNYAYPVLKNNLNLIIITETVIKYIKNFISSLLILFDNMN